MNAPSLKAASGLRFDARILAIAPLRPLDGLVLRDRRRTTLRQTALFVAAPLLAYGTLRGDATPLRGPVPHGPAGPRRYDGNALREVNAGITPERVHVCDLREFDARLFGVGVEGAHQSLPEWFQVHSSIALDLVCAVPDGTFLFITVGFAIFLYRKDYETMRRFA